MGAAEIAYRVHQALHARLEQRGMGLARAAGRWNSLAPWCDAARVQDLSRTEAADRILAGEWDVFSLRRCRLGFPPRWNRDPKTGVEAPLHFGKSINYRNERIVGDIKYLWEPNRHLELVTLAQAWRLTGEINMRQWTPLERGSSNVLIRWGRTGRVRWNMRCGC
jgi:hypothetical protein